MSDTTTTEPRLMYDLDGAAEQLSVSKRTVERLQKDGQIGSVKIGARRLYPHDELRAYVNRLRAVQA